MRDLLVSILGGFVLWAGLTCAMNKRSGPTIDVRVDNRHYSPVNLILADARNGTVLERLHNLSFGQSTRQVPFRSVQHRELTVAVDVHGRAVPYVVGMPTGPQVVHVRSERTVVCIDVGSRLRQSFLYLDSCAG